MRGKWMLLGLVLAGAAYAAHPPLFKPDMPPDWTWQQRDRASKALDVLFDVCPALITWLPDMQSTAMYMDDLTRPVDAAIRPLFAPLGWKRMLVVMIDTTPAPKSPIFKESKGINSITFYMGSGKKTGVFMEGGLFPEAVCGAKSKETWRMQMDPSYDTSVEPDAFIPAPALKLLDNF